MQGITHIDNFVKTHRDVFDYLKQHVAWDERMATRKTASYGVAYNYSQMSYPFNAMLPVLNQLCVDLKAAIGFQPNNCLINYYLNGRSKMGFHADQTDILEHGTGIAIVSVGAVRILRFRNIADKAQVIDFELAPGSLIYMTQAVQQEWEHAIPKSDADGERMSLTFREISPLTH